MACDAKCKRPSPAQAHCSVCHETFGSVSGFDHHRRAGVCHNPDFIGMVEGRGGVWRIDRPGAADRLAALRDAA